MPMSTKIRLSFYLFSGGTKSFTNLESSLSKANVPNVCLAPNASNTAPVLSFSPLGTSFRSFLNWIGIESIC